MILATAGYVGFFPIAPGTAGSAAGLLLYAAVRTALPDFELIVIAATFVIGVWAAGRVERELGKDPGPVVIDEVIGVLITLALLDVTIAGAIVGFFLFRILDVAKPYPANRLEHLHGGAGIMLDDVMAGVYANLALRALIALVPGVFA